MLEKTLEGPLDCKEIHQSILKEISPGISLEGMMQKRKLQYFGHLMGRVLELQLLHHSFQRNPRVDLLQNGPVDLLAVQGTLKSLLQHHSSKASILQSSPLFTVQLPHPYTTTGKTIALTRWTFVGKVMSLLLNILSRMVITFLPRSKHLLISWLQSPSAVILEPKKLKSDTVYTVSPSISHEVMGPDAMILVF